MSNKIITFSGAPGEGGGVKIDGHLQEVLYGYLTILLEIIKAVMTILRKILTQTYHIMVTIMAPLPLSQITISSSHLNLIMFIGTRMIRLMRIQALLTLHNKIFNCMMEVGCSELVQNLLGLVTI